MSKYSFDHEWGMERQRLRHFEALLDPGTIRELEAIGVSAGWHCLEVGGGGGSVAAWLCEKVAPDGSVTATDVKTSFLDELAYSNLSVLKHDIITDSLPENQFDLVHARAVLEHLPQPSHVLAKLIRGLKPGGWILVEDHDHHLILNTDDPDSPFRQMMKTAVRELVSKSGMDPFFGRKLYSALSSHGLLEVASEARAYQQAGGMPGAPGVWKLVFECLRESFVGTGAQSVEQFDELIKQFDRPEHAVMSPIYWAARGKRG